MAIDRVNTAAAMAIDRVNTAAAIIDIRPHYEGSIHCQSHCRSIMKAL